MDTMYVAFSLWGYFGCICIEPVDKASAQTPTLYGADICQTDEADAHP